MRSITNTLCVINFFLAVIKGQETEGPYDVKLESIKNCDAGSSGSAEISVTSTASVDENGETVISGNLILPNGLTDNMQAKGVVRILKNNEWQPINFIFSELTFSNACSDLESLVPIFFDIFKTTEASNQGCPIQQGTYHFQNYRVEGMIPPFDSLEFGTYRIQLTFFANQAIIGCITYLAQVVPAAETGSDDDFTLF